MHESSQWCHTDIPGTQIWHSLFLFRPLHVKLKVISDLRTADILESLRNQLSIQHDHVEDIHKQVSKIAQLLRKAFSTHTGVINQAHCFPRSRSLGGSSISHPMQRSYASSLYSRRGKTALAAVVQSKDVQSKDVQDKSKLRFWVPCIQATSTLLFLELLYTVQIPTNQSIKWKCSWRRRLWAERVKRPSTCPTRQFWNTSEQMRREIGDILPELAKIAHTALFVTMRGKRPLCHEYIAWTNHELGPVDENASRRIYHQLNPRSTKPVISRVPSRGMVATWH